MTFEEITKAAFESLSRGNSVFTFRVVDTSAPAPPEQASEPISFRKRADGVWVMPE